VATSNKCNQRLISIVLGANSPGVSNDIVKNMINDYYSAIGLDKLGPYCAAPTYTTTASTDVDEEESGDVAVTENSAAPETKKEEVVVIEKPVKAKAKPVARAT